VTPDHLERFSGRKRVSGSLQGGIARFETRLTALLSMRKVFDGIEKFLILRKLRSSCLEGRKALIQPIVGFLTTSFRRDSGPHAFIQSRAATATAEGSRRCEEHPGRRHAPPEERLRDEAISK
jgi:hypothetical protein